MAEREYQYYADIISAQSERTNKRMFIIILVLIAVIIGCVVSIIAINKARIDSLNELRELERSIETVYQYEFEQESDNNGNNYIVGGDYLGEAKN